MKQIFFFLLLSTSVYSQNVSLKPTNGRVTIQLDSLDYLIKRDTSLSGVVTLTLTPTTQVIKELESELGNISTEQDYIQTQIDILQQRKKDLNRKRKELEALIQEVSRKKEKKK